MLPVILEQLQYVDCRFESCVVVSNPLQVLFSLHCFSSLSYEWQQWICIFVCNNCSMAECFPDTSRWCL